MVKLLCLHGGEVTHTNGSVGYRGGKFSPIEGREDMSLMELKQMVSKACKLTDNLVEIDLNWRRLINEKPLSYELLPINTQHALQGMFEMFKGDYVIFVTTRGVQAASTPVISARHAANIGSQSVPFQDSVPFVLNKKKHAAAKTVPTTFYNGGFSSQSMIFKKRSAPGSVNSDWIDKFQRNEDGKRQRQSSVEAHLKRGSRFGSKEALESETKKWHIQNGYDYYMDQSTTSSVLYKCKNKRGKCLWFLMAFPSSGGWEIKAMGHPHSCLHSPATNKDKQLNIHLIADAIYPAVRADTGVKIAALQEMLRAKFMQDVSFSKTWRAKQHVIEQIFRTHDGAFQKLPCLMLALQQSNLETVFEFAWKEPSTPMKAIFDKMFWAFGATIEGFQHCRPLLSIGGTSLLGNYAGNVLVAAGYDSNNKIYPLCYAIVNSKTTASWTWFLERVRRHVTRDLTGICILSDSDHEIKRAVQSIFPEPSDYHRLCVRHFATTFNDKFQNEVLKVWLYKMASCTFKPKFDAWFEQFTTMDNGKYQQWLTLEKKETWALAYDKGYRYGNMTTNVNDVFENFLNGVCALPVTDLVEATLFRTNQYFNMRRLQIQQSILAGHVWPSTLKAEIEKSLDKKCNMEAMEFSHGRLYQVFESSGMAEAKYAQGKSYLVNIKDRSCDCGEWALFHRPCSHAMSAIAKANMDYKDYVDPFLGNESYLQAYTPELQPLGNRHFWPNWTGPRVECDPAMLRKSSETSTECVHPNPPGE